MARSALRLSASGAGGWEKQEKGQEAPTGCGGGVPPFGHRRPARALAAGVLSGERFARYLPSPPCQPRMPSPTLPKAGAGKTDEEGTGTPPTV